MTHTITSAFFRHPDVGEVPPFLITAFPHATFRMEPDLLCRNAWLVHGSNYTRINLLRTREAVVAEVHNILVTHPLCFDHTKLGEHIEDVVFIGEGFPVSEFAAQSAAALPPIPRSHGDLARFLL